ncbi:hypothetical protein AVEN_88527-1 [Araneus ventricosus]|uniref:HTH CENPB-type domain-containing protein n=1 Tax=Araneus ventricosus TaxID=182803 RepID=A0A4Y2E4U9_ARAVE|nr:hypothetical protein AVEN_88527-1 [Araneus ventricosus]
MRHEKYVDMNEAVLEWFKTFREKKIPVSGLMIQYKAKELVDTLGIEISQLAMDDWTGFAYGLTSPFDHCVSKRPLSTPVHVKIGRNVFQCFWLDMMTITYSKMDETALFSRALPNKSMFQKSEEARGGKIPKERLTISFCMSAAGGKEKPLIIWRSQRPRLF